MVSIRNRGSTKLTIFSDLAARNDDFSTAHRDINPAAHTAAIRPRAVESPKTRSYVKKFSHLHLFLYICIAETDEPHSHTKWPPPVIRSAPHETEIFITSIKVRIMVSYKDLGLVNTREMFKKAINGGYAVPAFNFNNMEQMQAISRHVSSARSP